MKIPEFQNKSDLFKFLSENKDKIIAAKKATFKMADAFGFSSVLSNHAGVIDKANNPIQEDIEEIKVKIVINTTNLMDSMDDVHIPGLWKKSLSENKDIFHDQEHKHEFSSTISDYEDLKAYTQTMSWVELGQNYIGQTEALIFESVVKEERNHFMFEQYMKGRVKQHSVGMQYVKISLAMNEKAYPDEFKVWNKYIDQIANREEVEKQGYFFAVTEAKAIEGSAVKRGANWATPTLENNMKSEPVEATPNEPEKSTQLTSEEIKNRIKNIKIFS